MIKNFITKSYSTFRALTEDMAKYCTKITNNDGIIIDTNILCIPMNGNKVFVGNIFYQVGKTNNFTLR